MSVSPESTPPPAPPASSPPTPPPAPPASPPTPPVDPPESSPPTPPVDPPESSPPTPPVDPPARPRTGPLAGFQERSFWQATMPALPDRRGRPLPDAVDVVVVGGGLTGIATARQLARQGAVVTVLEAETLGWGASTRNGGIVHPGYKWGPKALIARYGDETGRALYAESLAGYERVKALIAEEAIDCSFEERGHVELAYAPSHVAGLEEERESLARVGVEATVIGRDRIREEIGTDAYFGALVFERSGGLHPGRFFAGLAEAAARAGADLHEGVRATGVRPQADGRVVVETDRGAIIARDVVVATNGYTDGAVPALRRRVIPIGSYIIVTEVLPEDLAAELSPKGRMFFDTKNFLYYWRLTPDRRMLFGGRASFRSTSMERTAEILHRGLVEVHPQLRSTPIEYAWGGNLGFTMDRMPHVGRMAGVTYALGCCGTGVSLATYLGTGIGEWLGGGAPPVLSRLPFPLVPVPFEGRPWFLPVVGEYFAFRDRLAARGR